MRRFQELTVAIGCGVNRGWFQKSTWPVCKLHEESDVEPESTRWGRVVGGCQCFTPKTCLPCHQFNT